MTVDAEGYGPRADQSPVERLLEDVRTLSPSSIERVAEAWRHDEPAAALPRWHDAERAALRILENTDRAAQWEALRSHILDLTEHHAALIAWRQEHGEPGHRAEDALLGAALALLTGHELDAHHRRTLLHPMGAALPWLDSLSA